MNYKDFAAGVLIMLLITGFLFICTLLIIWVCSGNYAVGWIVSTIGLGFCITLLIFVNETDSKEEK